MVRGKLAPLNVPKVPRTLLTIRWRTENPMDEWTGSMVHVPALRPVVEAAVVMVFSPSLWVITGSAARSPSVTGLRSVFIPGWRS